MNINTITAEDLRRMSDKEGLILQGCGGDLTEWVDAVSYTHLTLPTICSV